MPGVGHEVSVNGDGLAVVLVRPAGVVAVDLDAEGHVCQEGHHVGLPIVESLQRGQVGLEKDLSPRSEDNNTPEYPLLTELAGGK